MKEANLLSGRILVRLLGLPRGLTHWLFVIRELLGIQEFLAELPVEALRVSVLPSQFPVNGPPSTPHCCTRGRIAVAATCGRLSPRMPSKHRNGSQLGQGVDHFLSRDAVRATFEAKWPAIENRIQML